MTDDHLSLDELAELDEDLLSPKRASAARAHLDGCAQCRASADAIASTRALLADLPTVTMPADVAARLDRAIAAEAGRTADEAGASNSLDTSSTTVVPNVVAMPRRSFGRPTMAASAAAAAVVLVIGAIVIGVAHHPSSSDGGTTASPALSQLSVGSATPTGNLNFPAHSTGLTYTPASLSSDVASLLAIKASPASAVASPEAPSAAASAPPSRTSGSPKNPSPKNPVRATSSLKGVVQSSSGLSAQTRQPVPHALLPLYSSRTKLLACAESQAPTLGSLPVAVDFGLWSAPAANGQPATTRAPSVILVYAAPGPPNSYAVEVVGPTCGTDALRQYNKFTLPN